MDHCPLDQYAVVRVTGADAVPFLQGQLTQDVARVGPHSLLRAALNTPQGRVVALPWLFAGDGALRLLLPAALVVPLAERLRRYVLRAKVRLEAPEPGLALVGLPATTAAALDAAFGPAPEGPRQSLAGNLSLLRFANRALLVGPPAALADCLAARASRAVSASRWSLAVIAAGDAEVLAASSEHWVAQMLNLDLVDGISFTKGCYTGQEIIARTQNLGRIKRRMFRYRRGTAGMALPAPKDRLSSAGANVGEVVLAAADGDGAELLAVVNLEARDRPLADATGAPYLPAALPYAVP
jgi:folate-binding protein YgfZ